MQILAVISAIPSHAVTTLLVQVALLLFVARVGAESAKRVGIPPVVGELAAGLLLGPSVFGHVAPGTFATIFPQTAEQFHLLETVGTLGMVMLLLLTGLETDLRLLRNLGRSALVASASGMVLPFVLGFALGMWMPASYLAQPGHRTLFSAFLATAMAISAMPVIAKILMDLDLTKRNIGVVILSAGVVDDTAGWLILSVIAGAATSGAVRFAGVLTTIGWMVVYLVVMGVVVYPLLRVSMRAVARFKSDDADLVFIMVVTFLSAAATEKIGIHAVFGAFVAGTVLRQVPQLRDETVHKLESFVFAVLSPVFFGIVGLKVNLWTLGGGTMLGLVVLVACVGKLVGCTVGGLWGGLRFWEAFSIAVAMNARGAMELVVATIGLSLGILNQQMFSIIVVVAIFTSFVAPLALRLTMRMVRMTEDEERRILAEEFAGTFDPARMRVLVPTAGGPNALEAASIGMRLSRRSDSPVEVLSIDARVTLWERLSRFLSNDHVARTNAMDAHLEQIQKRAEGGPAPRVRRVQSDHVAATIVDEARKGADLIVIGASQRGPAIGGPILEEVVAGAPCHVAIVRSVHARERYARILVPIDGSTPSRVAAEFGLRVAESFDAELTLAVMSERRGMISPSVDADRRTPRLEPRVTTGRFGETARRGPAPAAGAPGTADAIRSTTLRLGATEGALALAPPILEQTDEEEIVRISTAFRSSQLKPRVLHLQYDPTSSEVQREVASGTYDLIVLGAENRAVQHRLFFGYENQRLIQRSPVTIAIVIPNVARLQ